MKIEHGKPAVKITDKTFNMEEHYYNKVLHAQIHQLVKFFMNMDKKRIVERFCHLNPIVNREELIKWLNYKPKYIQWSGTDLFHVTTEKGEKRMVVIETNSSPSGQKSMPLLNDNEEMGGYKRLIERSFLPFIKEKRAIQGDYAVLYDKNEMEATGYAIALAQLVQEDVYLVPFFNEDHAASVRFNNEVMQVRDENENWHDIKAAYRYVTQKPWNRIPIKTKTILYNPIIACLAGGRNKRLASKAYDIFNAELKSVNLKIRTPETINDVKLKEIPLWLERFGGQAVVKNPYSNAGQGVYTITSQSELDAFMAEEHDYNDFIIQSLVGNYNWSTTSSDGKYYHVGMIPNKKSEIYVADLRFMIASTRDGFAPMALYARRAEEPLKDELEAFEDSWKMLGTNLSVKTIDGWDSEIRRLKLMDNKDFNQLGLSLDSLIEAYIQSVLSTIAIDKMANQLIGRKKNLKLKLFNAINGDQILMDEIMK
ncbi:hypothetical protein [Wukongibacter sp. M2B1]|uniref:hypothetical protein n=1 Tax=Wukongibacter sp. M2B1 TaxID=3088895 RepID=UPI003D7A1FFC